MGHGLLEYKIELVQQAMASIAARLNYNKDTVVLNIQEQYSISFSTVKLLKEENEAFTIDSKLGIEDSVMEIALSPSKLLNWAQSLSPLPHQVGWSHGPTSQKLGVMQRDNLVINTKKKKMLTFYPKIN